jgi:lipopolysaccharide/colanic/teichoic acid biosynthesis glycosyltransferase
VSDAAKRIFDLVVAGGGLLLILPIIAAIALTIKLTSDGPVLFRQVRVGRREQPFSIMKFRTMTADAPSRGPQITLGADPRITPVGAVLRRYKLDELQQLFNVVFGDMSLVGPRPETPDYVAHYPIGERREIFQVRPGITDNASITFSNESELLGRAENPLDYYVNVILPKKRALYLDYVRNRSFFGDIAIIWRTIAVILNGRESQS